MKDKYMYIFDNTKEGDETIQLLCYNPKWCNLGICRRSLPTVNNDKS